MRLSDHLPAGAVLVLTSAATRVQLFPLLVDAICEAHGLSGREQILTALAEREAKMSTAVGRMIAIPHVRVESVAGLCAGAAICPPGIDFPTPDGEPVKLAILLVSPPSAAGLHVKALAAVGRLGPQMVEDLLASSDAADFLQRLRSGEDAAGK